jgi:hypothetical protein
MISLVALALAASPSPITLSRHLPKGVFLVEQGALAQQTTPPPLPSRSTSPEAGAETPPPPPPPLPNRSQDVGGAQGLAQLEASYAELEANKPSLALPIVLLATGGVVSLFSLYLLPVGVVSSGFLIAGLVGLAIGLPMIGIGVWMLISRIGERRQINQDQDVLKEQIERLRIPASPGNGPGQVFADPAPVLLARF